MLSDMDRPSIRLNLVSLSFARKGAGALTCPAGRLRRDRRPREPALSGVEGSLRAKLAKVFVIPMWFGARNAELRWQTSPWPTPRPYRARSTRSEERRVGKHGR